MSHRLTKEELDEQFELFLKESVSDDSLDLGSSDKQPSTKSSQKLAKKPSVSLWEDDEHSGQGTGRGLLASGKTFKKSFRKSQSILEEEEDPGGTSLKDDELEAADLSRNRTGTEALVPAASTTNIGLDTLEEEEEKAMFFAQLEARALSTIDYSKLNKELDSTNSTINTSNRKAEGAVEQSNDDQRKAKVTETIRESPAFTGSPHYSEDFEEEENGKELLEEGWEVVCSVLCLTS